MKDVTKYGEEIFESIKHVNEYGIEFWYARELQKVLEYGEWRNLEKVIEKSKSACRGSGNKEGDHFVDVNKMVQIGSETKRKIRDIMLTRYACYLIVQNSDPRKEVIALGQTYFAMQTRKIELLDKELELEEDRKRIAIRNELKEHNKRLVAAAKSAGIETRFEYGTFQNFGYRGLYGV
jgi:DNA-damage-inducible protein D